MWNEEQSKRNIVRNDRGDNQACANNLLKAIKELCLPSTPDPTIIGLKENDSDETVCDSDNVVQCQYISLYYHCS